MKNLMRSTALPFAAMIIMSGCATVNKSTEKEAANTNDLYRSGNIQDALISLDASFNKKSSTAAKDKAKNDTIYYLEKGTYLGNLGQSKLNESSQNFLVVRNTIKDWEDQVAPTLKMNPQQLMSSISDSMSVSRFYIPRDYEKSFVGFDLMSNHALAKRFDLAFVEAKATTELDEFLTKERKVEFDGANLKAKDQLSSSGISAGISSVDQIQGYPVDTFNSEDVLELKNSYFNAGTYYLAGFISEAMGSSVSGVAEPYYQTAIKINPLPFYKQALNNAAKKIKPRAKQSDTLIIVDTGFLSDIYSFKATIPFATGSGPKAVTWVVPAIKNNAVMYNPQKLDVKMTDHVDERGNIIPKVTEIEAMQQAGVIIQKEETKRRRGKGKNKKIVEDVTLAPEPEVLETPTGKALPLNLVSNVEAMSKRELKDQMPTYIARAIASSAVQIVAQELAARALDSSVQDPIIKALLKLASSAAVNVLAAGDVDTRMWKSLPSSVYMARVTLPQGSGMITIPTPAGSKQVEITLNSPYEVIKLRVFNDGVVVSNYPNPLSDDEYGKLVFDRTSAIK